MSIAATSFTGAAASATSILRPGERAVYSVNGTYTGTIIIERLVKSAAAFEQLRDILGALITVTDTNLAGVVENTTAQDQHVRFRSTGAMTGTAVATLTDLPAGANITAGVGAKAGGATVTVREEGDGIAHKTTLFFNNTPLTLLDADTGEGLKVYDFPAGRINFLGALGSIALITTSVLATTLNASAVCNWGLGSTTQANGTLATTEQDIIPTTNVTASATINVAGAAAAGQLAATFQLDGTSTPVDAFLNIGVAGATDIDGDATVIINGSVQITWINLGDV